MWEDIEVYIALSNCKDRKLYRICARNFNIGVFNKTTSSFFGLRTKFGDTFIDNEYHWDFDPRHGTAKPIEELPEELPAEIECEYRQDTKCENCQKFCEYVLWPEGGVREIALIGGGKMNVYGEWKHLKEYDCKEVVPVGIYNYGLDRWLREMKAKYQDKT